MNTRVEAYLRNSKDCRDAVNSKNNVADLHGDHTNEQWGSLPYSILNGEELLSVELIRRVDKFTGKLDNGVLTGIFLVVAVSIQEEGSRAVN